MPVLSAVPSADAKPANSDAPATLRYIQTSLNPKVLTGALKAVLEFASKDETRHILNSVLCERKKDGTGLRFVATDGHTLCQVDVTDTDTVSAIGAESRLLSRADVEALLLKAKHGATEFRFEGEDSEGFPEYSRVIPAAVAKGEMGERRVGFNPAYLARIEKVRAAISVTEGKSAIPPMATIQMGADNFGPLRAELSDPVAGIAAVVVIMPMRLD